METTTIENDYHRVGKTILDFVIAHTGEDMYVDLSLAYPAGLSLDIMFETEEDRDECVEWLRRQGRKIGVEHWGRDE
jgi:malate/lactate dehydrogenase